VIVAKLEGLEEGARDSVTSRGDIPQEGVLTAPRSLDEELESEPKPKVEGLSPEETRRRELLLAGTGGVVVGATLVGLLSTFVG
jgi:hypothetical protein